MSSFFGVINTDYMYSIYYTIGFCYNRYIDKKLGFLFFNKIMKRGDRLACCSR